MQRHRKPCRYNNTCMFVQKMARRFLFVVTILIIFRSAKKTVFVYLEATKRKDRGRMAGFFTSILGRPQ